MKNEKMITNKIYQGNALEVLKTFPDESINCVMTSPPYWSLRDYQIEEIIWDSDKNCEHDFNIEEKIIKNKHRSGFSIQEEYASGKDLMQPKETTIKEGFCQKCSAWKGQLGLEPSFDLYIKHLCDIFDEVKRALRKDGACWVNLGDTYYSVSGSKFLNDNINSKDKNLKIGLSTGNELKKNKELKQKNLCNIPARFSIEMQNRGWILRNVIIWKKNNVMPSSVKDRFTVDFEYLFFFVKNQKYYFETQREPNSQVSIKRAEYENRRIQDGKSISSIGSKSEKYGMPARFVKLNPEGHNKRCVWTINTKPFKESHFATFPEELCETPIKAGCPNGGIVLDPFFGAGTTGLVALKQNKKFIGIELNTEYIKIANKRLKPFLEQQKLI